MFLRALLLGASLATANRVLQDENNNAEVSFVVEPFEFDNELWSVRDATAAIVEERLFGNHALRIQSDGEKTATSELTYLPNDWSAPYNCFGAETISIWAKLNISSLSSATTPTAVSRISNFTKPRIRVDFWDDAACMASAATEDQKDACNQQAFLDSHTVLEEEIDPEEDWRELTVSASDLATDLRRIRGWSIQLEHPSELLSNEDEGSTSIISLYLDQMACHGDGSLFGASFFQGQGVNFAQASKENSWGEEYYKSELSQNESTVELFGQEGRLSWNYTIQQTEEWGGYSSVKYTPPGASYYNISGANGISLSYSIGAGSSNPGKSNLRFILLDSSDCFEDCALDDQNLERWYSFHSVLDNSTATPGRIEMPLVGSTEPGSPFWLTGWAGQIGNQQLDLEYVYGFYIELNMDSSSGINKTVSGALDIWSLSATKGDGSDGSNTGLGDPKCVIDREIVLEESSPLLKKYEFRADQCCQICDADPNCLYAMTEGNGHCFTASSLDYNSISLSNTTRKQNTVTTFWMDDPIKRGDFCELCTCDESSKTIDCKGQNLKIIPKTFSTDLPTWSAKILDLRENDALVFLGSDSLSAIAETLEEIWLPSSLRHINPSSLEGLPSLRRIEFDDESLLNNAITSADDFFSDVCCGLGQTLDFVDSIKSRVTFCEMVVDAPGVDSTYNDFETYLDASIVEAITPSSDFLSEAAESPEKCAAFCSINRDCRYFSYDGRYKNSEHICYLLENNGSRAQRVCCDPDHYEDAEQTIPGWVSGYPPQTRHSVDIAQLLISESLFQADQKNNYQIQYELKLGSKPKRGAVWIRPTSLSTEANVKIEPAEIALYNADQVATVRVTVPEVDADTTILIRNSIQSCDEAFMMSEDPDAEVVFISILAVEGDEEVNYALAVGLPIALVLIFGLLLYLIYEQRQKQDDSFWKIDKKDLKFSDPPEIVGRGTFGLVLKAEYRGTQVAVKRVLPPRRRSNQKKQGVESGTNSGASETGGSGSEIFGRAEEFAASSRSSLGLNSLRRLKSNKIDEDGVSSMVASVGWKTLRSDFKEEMRLLSKLRHPNVTTVMGAVIGSKVEPMLIMEYMDHGSLYNLLHNDTIIVEGELLFPILKDITQGMRFLHTADPHVIHGDLKAHNILVDSKFRAKVADFGLTQKKNSGGTGSPFWMAPEVLRGDSSNTTESDIYSFGIVLYEVYSRKEPYEGENPLEVISRIMDHQVKKRPPLPKNCPEQVRTIMSECLREDPSRRPSFEELDIRLKREEVENFEYRQSESATSKQQRPTTVSLFDIFPQHIAEALLGGQPVEPEHRECVTIFFSDIVNFTEISSRLAPQKVANLLDRLYTEFDTLSQKHDVFKVETIGDAYMVATNLIKDQEQDHTKRIAEFAIEAIQVANKTLIDVEDEEQGFVQLRAGFHSGSVVADVVGTRNPRYCLFGDSVNTASRMESNSQANRIHCSSSSAELLRLQCPSLPLKSRGAIPIKGKGEMQTYWVNEEGAGLQANLQPAQERSILTWAKQRSSKILRRNSSYRKTSQRDGSSRSMSITRQNDDSARFSALQDAC